ncbi:hypothetical protein PMAYCL1PPCAC_26725, partial [Pristionchus mayeri]
NDDSGRRRGERNERGRSPKAGEERDAQLLDRRRQSDYRSIDWPENVALPPLPSLSNVDRWMSSAPRRPLREGDWARVDAKYANINKEFHKQCTACVKKRPEQKSRLNREIGKDQAEKSKGLFAAEDWACTKYGNNVNWARRNTCNMCNASKVSWRSERATEEDTWRDTMSNTSIVRTTMNSTSSVASRSERGLQKKAHRTSRLMSVGRRKNLEREKR